MSTTTTRNTSRRIELRPPEIKDGAVLWRMAKDSQALDLNSPYAYLMWCDRFAQTSVVAEVDGWPAGFLVGFRPPGQPDVLFVWQVAVADEYRGLGLASRMLDDLLQRDPALSFVEATVTPSNEASQRLFRALARRNDCPCSEEPYLRTEHFPSPGHEPEHLFRIGPIASKDQ
jgi:L-2,4-diaminobutyric acid acetyltransferase